MPAKTPSPADGVVMRKSLKSTLFLQTFVLMAFTVVAASTSAFFLARGEMRIRVFKELQAIADSKEELLQSTVIRQREQVSVLAQNINVSTLPIVTSLVGFQSLFAVSSEGEILMIEGDEPDEETALGLLEADLKSESAFIPIFSPSGWESYAIVATRANRSPVVALFDADPLLLQLLGSVGDSSADVQLGVRDDNDLILLHTTSGQQGTASLYLGSLSGADATTLSLGKAVMGREGIEESADYAGIPVIAAYRSIPALGWGMVIQIDRQEVYGPILRLALNILSVGLILVGLLSLVMMSLAHRITSPLASLTLKLSGLEAKGWNFKRSVFTGNELELVDAAAYSLTGRLKDAYQHLEAIVKQRTQALMDANATDEAIFQSIEYGLIATDAKGRIVLMNDAAARITGFKRQQSVGQPFETVLIVADDAGKARTTKDHPLTSVLTTKKKFTPGAEAPVQLVKRGGTPVPVALQIMPICRGRRCSGAVAIFRDITEEQRVDRMKSEFISLVSHQLRTPLSSMRWNLEILETDAEKELSPEHRRCLHEVDAANRRMVRLVEALLNVSRIELKKMEVKEEEIDVANAVSRITADFSHDIRARQIKVSVKLPDSGETSVTSDSVMLGLILENLIGNAIKYSRPHGGHIVIALSHTKKQACITVTDDGIGIPDEARKHIFEKLYRAKNAVESDTDGNGLGLYISRLGAESIGATLSFESKPGKGTEFSVTLPSAPHPE